MFDYIKKITNNIEILGLKETNSIRGIRKLVTKLNKNILRQYRLY